MGALAAKELLEQRIGAIETERAAAVASIVEKWAPMLNEININEKGGRGRRDSSAMLYENVMFDLTRNMTEDIRTQNVGPFQKFIFPVLRLVVPNMIAHDLVSVQPLNAPIGAIFYLEAKYGSQKGQTQIGDTFPTQFNRNYSGELVENELAHIADGIDGGGPGPAVPISFELGYFPVRGLNAQEGWSVTITEVSSAGVVIQSAVDDGSSGFVFTPAGANTSGTINYNNGMVNAFNFQNLPTAGNRIYATYYYDNESTSRVPMMQMDIKSAPIKVTTRKLKTIWSMEAAEDARALHAIDIESESVANASQSILYEVDREILDDLFKASAASGINDIFDATIPAAVAELDHLRSVTSKMSKVGAEIHTQTKRAHANWVVTTPLISSMFSQMTTHGDYRPLWVTGDPMSNPMDMPRPMTSHGQFGIYKKGTLQNKYTIYEDPDFPRGFMMMGLKGSGYLDSGYVYAPYQALNVTPSLPDPNDFTIRKGFRIRYAKKLTRANFYGQIRVINL